MDESAPPATHVTNQKAMRMVQTKNKHKSYGIRAVFLMATC
jgi:hypothetical protein